jgi:erythromycin esterase-like protein
MWANEEFQSFVIWLRDYNKSQVEVERVSIIGMDLYSLQTSINDVISYLKEHDAACADRVEAEYSCFGDGDLDPQLYGMLVEKGLHSGCVDAAANACLAIKEDQSVLAHRPELGLSDIDEAFITEMNAHIVQGAEKYYRSMFAPNANSWNVRDRHFMDQVHRVMEHLVISRGEDFNRVVVWAHNSHVGNSHHTHLEKKQAMMTDEKRYQSGGGGGEKEHEFNIGQLAKEEYPDESLLVGQFTYTGTVACADDWGGPQRVKPVRPGLLNSMEEVLHTVSGSGSNLLINLTDPDTKKLTALRTHRLQRAIGVIYRPDTERWSHYYTCDLSNQFDVVLWHDITTAVCPLVLL